MHSWETTRGTRFLFNSDCSGDMRINDGNGNEITVPAEDILEFVAWMYVARQKIERLEQASVDDLLLGPEFANTKRKMTSR